MNATTTHAKRFVAQRKAEIAEERRTQEFFKAAGMSAKRQAQYLNRGQS
jgi:hypothetical protein